MGSFNVACSVSNISISPNDKVVFIPLLPTNFDYQDKVIHKIKPNLLLIYADCYFTPVSLPIHGVYGDYGYLDNIKRDANVESIESYFNIPIEDFVKCIGFSGEYYRYGSLIFEYFVEHKNLDEEQLNEEFLLTLGFKKEKDTNYYIFKNKYISNLYKVELFEEQDISNRNRKESHLNFKIYDENNNLIFVNQHYYVLREFYKQYNKLTNYYLNVKPKLQRPLHILSNMSGMFVLQDIYDKLSEFHLNDERQQAVGSYLKEKHLEYFGFRKIPKEEQILIDSRHSSLWRKNGYPFDVKLGEYGSILIHQKYQEYFNFGDKRFISEIKQGWKKATKTNVEDTFPILAETDKATDEEFESIKKVFKELTGAEMNSRGNVPHKHSIYSVNDFVECWKEETNEILDVKDLRGTYIYDEYYDNFRNTVLKYEEKLRNKNDFKQELKDPEKGVERVRLSEDFDIVFDCPFSHHNHRNDDFYPFFKKWLLFKELYKHPIINNQLKDEFKRYRAFYWTMYSCNRFFFPAMNGEQCGNHEASKVLLDASLKFVENKIKEQEY